MNEPVLTLSLPLTSVNAILNSLAQTGNTLQVTQASIQQQAQAQLQPPVDKTAQPEPGTAPTAPSNVVAVEFAPDARA